MKIGRALVVAALAVSAASRAQDPALGVVQQAIRAQLKQNPVSDGASIYAGEELSTDTGGLLALSVSTAGFQLHESSRAFFYRSPKSPGPVAELRNGGITYRKEAGTDNITIVASDVRVVSKGDGVATGQVVIVSPCEVRVTTVTGQVDVTSGKETRTVEENKSYSVIPETSVFDVRKNLSPDDDDYHKFHSHKTCAALPPKSLNGIPNGDISPTHFLLKVGVPVGVVTGIIVWKAMESPSHP
jgi:hypothetical protein